MALPDNCVHGPIFRFAAVCRTGTVLALVLAISFASAWRSQLYPVDWKPEQPDAQGRLLHDFSYAGYRMGEKPIPAKVPGAVLDVTKPPYSADSSGVASATQAIQKAIDDAGKAGGGTVYLPAGTYRLTLPSGASQLLNLNRSGVHLQGAGKGRTFLYVDHQPMRGKDALMIGPGRSAFWFGQESNVRKLSADSPLPTRELALESVDGLKPGDWVLVRADCTDDFAWELDLKKEWGGANGASLKGITYYRKIVTVDISRKSVTIDIPTRFALKVRDNARVYKIGTPHIEEVGVTGLSIGARESTKPGWEFRDDGVSGTGAYEVHGANMIRFNHVVNGWLSKVGSYMPPINAEGPAHPGLHDAKSHMPSDGVQIDLSRNITIDSCRFENPQFEGNGGNGYMYILAGQDCLIRDSEADDGRHNFSAKSMWCSGNVVYNCVSTREYLENDFHMHLCHANLFDSFKGGSFDADWRGGAGTIDHGHTSAQNVFWNNRYTKRVKSQQFGWGYVIGCDNTYLTDPVRKDPVKDFEEGTGQGATLEPASLYLDQLARRLKETPTTATTTLAPALRPAASDLSVRPVEGGFLFLDGRGRLREVDGSAAWAGSRPAHQ